MKATVNCVYIVGITPHLAQVTVTLDPTQRRGTGAIAGMHDYRQRELLDAAYTAAPGSHAVIDVKFPGTPDARVNDIDWLRLPVAVAARAARFRRDGLPPTVEGVPLDPRSALVVPEDWVVHGLAGAHYIGHLRGADIVIDYAASLGMPVAIGCSRGFQDWQPPGKYLPVTQMSDLAKAPVTTTIISQESPSSLPDMSDVIGQPAGRLALEVAALTGWPLHLSGRPGCGRSMMACRLPGIMPEMTGEEHREVRHVFSAAGLRGSVQRPFRAPHHSISVPELVSGATTRPGEVHLAHNGVLLLDEVDVFPGPNIAMLDATLKSGTPVSVPGTGLTGSLPMKVQLVTSSGLSPCGFAPGSDRCRCSADVIFRFNQRLARQCQTLGIVLGAELHGVTPEAAMNHAAEPSESSASIRERVRRARDAAAADGVSWRLDQGVPVNHLIESAILYLRGCICDGDVESITKVPGGAR